MIDRTACELRHRWLHAAAFVVLFLLMSQAAVAAVEPVGRMISADGDVTAVRAGESARSLDRGDPVYEGDELRTGTRATAQIRFSDGGLFALEADTRFAVDTYERDDDGAGSAFMTFLQGALRTITGTIGSRERDNYQLRTPTATIGVRGTSYALSYCNDACAEGHGGQPGTYGRVSQGSIRVTTPGGSAEFGNGAYFFVPEGGLPREILKPPEGVLGGDDEESSSDEGVDGTAGDVSEGLIGPSSEAGLDESGSATTTEPIFEVSDEFEAPEQPDEPDQPGEPVTPEPSVTGISGAAVTASAMDQQAAMFSGLDFFPEGGAFTTDASGNVVSAQFTSSSEFQVTNATLEESGTVSALEVSWGRWSGGFDVDGNPATGNLSFAVTDNFTDPTNLSSLSGTLNYGNPTGPQPFDNNGDLWSVDALSLGVDFDAVDVTLNQFDLSPASGGTGLSFSDTDVFGSDLDLSANGLALSVANINGGAALIGRFVGGSADGLIVLFQANQGQTLQIHGTQVLVQQ